MKIVQYDKNKRLTQKEKKEKGNANPTNTK